MNINFLTFASHNNYLDAGKRLMHQANQLNVFKECKLFTFEELQNTPEFWNAHSEFVTKNARGCGYWLWKPFIIKNYMERMQNGDILLYLDCGCELDNGRKDNLLKCIEIVKTDKIVGTKVFTEKEWTKMDLINKLNMNEDKHLQSNIHEAGTILFLVCDETRRLVDEWYCLGSEYHNIDDSPSITQNLDSFKEHRHDQSIFSLLTKKYNLFSSMATLHSAVYYIRNLSGKSQIN
jgi:hypothetical protein